MRPAVDMEDDAALVRYLGLLGVARRPPGLEALTELTSAHLTRIPFENVSKLYYGRRNAPPRRPPDLVRYLDGIERHHLGGTCYANAFNLHLLLAHLGYDVSLCGADMSAPDVHLVNVVWVEGRPYLVDVGYGAPFLEPLPLDVAEDQEIAWGRERYVLTPRDAAGRSRLELHRDGELRHGYTVNPAPRRIEEFAQVIADSFSDEATFMHALLIARFWPTRSVTLRNRTLIEAEGTRYRLRQIPGRADLPAAIEEHFLIPRGMAREALDGVDLTMQA
ncbi:MAG TPA: arylamine N-acetyltransferase [Vicinamibacteria bacterium]